MAKGLSLILIALSVLTIKTQAFSVVNNVAVPSDILTSMLFEGIRNTTFFDTSFQSTPEYSTPKCVVALQHIVTRFPNLDVLSFIDSWGKLPSGLLYGHWRDLGNFDQCIRASGNWNEALGIVRGQYCSASIPLIQSTDIIDSDVFKIDQRAAALTPQNILRISVGICIPDVCDPKLVELLFQTMANRLFSGALSGLRVSGCQADSKPEFKAVNIAGIVIFSIVGALLVLSTAYDVITKCLEKPVIPSLLAFSVYTNGKKLFAINTKKSPNNIDCLTGIRVLSMFWVLYCHNYMFSGTRPLINYIDYIPWFKAASSMHVRQATVSVDTFLFISGLLIAWIGFRELDKNKGKLNVPMMYFHRYLRLTPAVAAMMLFLVSIDQYIGTGPMRNVSRWMNDACKTNWWSTLLYVQNYVHTEDTCVPQTWYLAVDTQLYILSPLFLLALRKWGRKFTPFMVVLSLLSMGCVIATYFTKGYSSFLDTFGDNQTALTYYPTHTRYPVWLVGMGLGYFMYSTKNKPLRPSKVVQLFGWLVCFSVILAIIYGPYFTINSSRSTTVFEAAIYEAFKRVSWAIALSWLVYACHGGFGGVINSILSHPWWQPLGRLTFSLYLVHMAVQGINFGITRTDEYFSDYQQVLMFWSTFGVSCMAAIVLTLSFESPILVIEKTLLNPSNAKVKVQDNSNGIHSIESFGTTQKSV